MTNRTDKQPTDIFDFIGKDVWVLCTYVPTNILLYIRPYSMNDGFLTCSYLRVSILNNSPSVYTRIALTEMHKLKLCDICVYPSLQVKTSEELLPIIHHSDAAELIKFSGKGLWVLCQDGNYSPEYKYVNIVKHQGVMIWYHVAGVANATTLFKPNDDIYMAHRDRFLISRPTQVYTTDELLEVYDVLR